MISITDKDNKLHEFEEHDNYLIQLHGITNERIIGSYVDSKGYVQVFTITKSGLPQVWSSKAIKLTPYDRFKDLKKAHSEGAIIEYNNNEGGWKFVNTPSWLKVDTYRIKGGISIPSWQTHQDLIKQYWEGAEIEYYNIDEWLIKINTIPTWNTTTKYRVKPQAKEMTLTEIAEELGYEVKIIKESK